MTNTLTVFDLKIFDLLFLELSQDKFFFAYVIFRGGSKAHSNDEEDGGEEDDSESDSKRSPKEVSRVFKVKLYVKHFMLS